MLDFIHGPSDFAAAALGAATHALQDVAGLLYERGWAYGTSGNYSLVLHRTPLRLLVTVSGRDKRRLTDRDFVIIDAGGRPLDPSGGKPSAEAALHVMLAQRPGVGAVLHTHSVWNTVLSDALFAEGHVRIHGFEMLKGLAGITTHEQTVDIPIVDNTQDIPALAERVARDLDARGDGPPHAFLMRGHGLYTWGRDLAEARRHVEVLEFLFEVTGRRRSP